METPQQQDKSPNVYKQMNFYATEYQREHRTISARLMGIRLTNAIGWAREKGDEEDGKDK